MFKSILAFCLTRRAVILVCLILFAVGGYLAFTKINIEAYPNPSPVILEINAQAAGLSAEEMERYYTIPMEVALYATPGVHVIRSTSFYGLSFVRVVFDYGVNYDFAFAQACIALEQGCSLPGGQIPSVNQNSGTGEIYRYQVVGPPRFSLTDLRTVQDWIVLRRLSTIPGIININSWGGPTKEFDVLVDPHKLETYGTTVPQMITALANANLNVGGREIVVGQQSINIRGVGLIDDGGAEDLTQGYHTEDIENIVLTQQNGVPVRIKDVSQVVVTNMPRLGIWGHDKEDDAVASIVVMTRTKHAHDMIPKVEKEVEAMNHDGTLPRGVKVVPFYNRWDLISITTHTVLHNLIFGCLLVFLIQWIFLGNLRSAIIVGVNIPFALFFAIIILTLCNESANLLSIGAVDFGIIVDSAVILVENIFRSYQKGPDERRSIIQHLADGWYGPDPTTMRYHTPQAVSGWTDRLRLILVSALQVDKSVLFSALITTSAFVPLFTMQGVEGQIFGPMARTYAYALAGALIATFTVTPVMASLLLPEQLQETETVIVRFLHRIYTPVLRFSLSHRMVMVGMEITLFSIAVLLVGGLGSEFLPKLEEGNYWIRVSMPTTLSLQDGEAATHKMRMILLNHPEITTVTSQHGRPDNGTDASPFSNVELYAVLKPEKQWPKGLTKDKLTDDIQTEFQNAFPGVIFNFSQYIEDNIEEAISGVKGVNSCKILGPNLETLTQLAHQVQDQMGRVRGICDLGIFPVYGNPNLNIKIDRQKASRYGLNTGDVNTVVQAAMGGATATQVLEGDRSWNLVVRYQPQFRDNIDKIKNIKVGYTAPNGAAAYIPLKELADVSLDSGGSWIYRETMKRMIPIKFSTRGRDLGSTVAEVQERIKKHVLLPPGYRIIWSGEFEDLMLAQKRLEVIVPVSLLLIVGLLYTLFSSWRDCLLALAGIPDAIVGGVAALFLTGQPFSISAAVGFVSLFGVSVMDGILMISYYHHEKRLGGTPAEAMFRAASGRMRPLLMTALSACIGLLPAAMSHGIGSQVQRPLATVVVGGMFLGSIMLLIATPALRLVFLGRDRAPNPAPETPAIETGAPA
jgi:cobalt-zinc-cadmium resistance protein CzcA